MDFIISDVGIRGLGLFLNIIGVVFMWAFGLPPRFNAETRAYIQGIEHGDESIKKAHIYDILAGAGMLILIAGFLLQFIANYVEGQMLFDLSFRPNY